MATIRNLILGAGPAGLQLGYFFARRDEPYLILERASQAGSFFAEYPRHDKLLSINKVYTGCPELEARLRYDWNSLLCDDERLEFRHYSKDYFPSAQALLRYLNDFAERMQLRIRYDSEVTRIERDAAGGYILRMRDAEPIGCERLFVATGLSREQLPDIPGLELCESYGSCSIDPQDYLDKRVMIIGKGNSAFETADNLIETTRKIWIVGARTVRLAWGTHYVGDLRAVNNNFLDTYQLKAQNNILDGELRGVRRTPAGDALLAEVYFDSRERSYEFECDHVLLCTGFRFDTAIFADDCEPELARGGKLPDMTCEWESTNNPNMFFAGTIMQSRDYRKTMSGFIHGFRHNVEALDAVLRRRDAGLRGWPKRRPLTGDVASLAELVIARLSTSAALLLQPGFLVDAVVETQAGELEYLLDVPADFVQHKLAGEYARFVTISLEYKHHDGYIDPLAMPRGQGVDEDYYLHPILREFVAGEQVSRLHLPDSLDNDWRPEPDCRAALHRYLGELLGAPARAARLARDAAVSPA